MEDDKLAAYYDELTQKGGGAARFKQGLGFSSANSTNNAVPTRGSALSTSSSFLSSFVKASSPATSSNFQKQAELESIQNKLNKAPKQESPNRDEGNRNSSRRSPDRDNTIHRHSRHRSRSRSRSPVRSSRRRSGSQSPDGYSRRRHRSRDRRSKRRSRSRSQDDFRSRRKHQSRSRSREREKERSKRRSRSRSPGKRRPENGKRHGEKKKHGEERGKIDYTKLIEGYDKMVSVECCLLELSPFN